jgi:hypothetical protein
MNTNDGKTVIQLLTIEDLSEDGTLTIGFSEEPDGGGRVLILMRAKSFDQKDVALGMDTYCLTDETGRTVYGGVVRHELSRDTLRLVLEPEAARKLGLPTEVSLRLQLDPETRGRVEKALRQMFG